MENTDERFYLLVAGSRTFDDYNLLSQVLDRLLVNHRDVVVIEGGARGADRLAGQYAEERSFGLMVFPADWETYGKRAGFVRNRQMHLELARHEKRGCVLFWDMQSRGTKHNIGLCEEYKTSLRIIDIRRK